MLLLLLLLLLCNAQLRAKGEGLAGGVATCATSSPGGAVVFWMRNGTQPGYQPFKGATSLDFWIKSNTKTNDPYASDTPPGKVPPIKIFLMHVSRRELGCQTTLVAQRVASLQ
jgi:hypothetical protein